MPFQSRSTLKNLIALARPGSRRRRKSEAAPSVPEGHRIYAIGDIHGRVDLLATLHRHILADAKAARCGMAKTIVYLGDYVDRGLNSKAVLDFLINSSREDLQSIYLMGNHEEMFLRFLEDSSLGPAWFAVGGDATALSYGVRIPEGLSTSQKFEHVRERLKALVPQNHLDFFTKLRLAHVVGDFVFVHAGIRPGIPLDRQDRADMLWIRDDFLKNNHGLDKVIVHGHSLSHTPEVHRYRIGIDTGAYATNVLTCLVLEGAERYFLSTKTQSPVSHDG